MSNEFYKVIQNLWNIDNNNKSYSPYEFKEKNKIRNKKYYNF